MAFLKTTQANIYKMKLHTGTCWTTNIQLVLESALVKEIALTAFSNQLPVQEMKFIIDFQWRYLRVHSQT